MQQSLKSVAIGTVSGVLTYAASIYTIGYTSALAMPPGFSISLWQAVVIFGLGASLVAFLILLVALRLFPAKATPAFLSFAVAAAFALAIAGLLPLGFKALIAWLVGALLAAVTHNRLRPNNSFKPKPLRGSA